MVSVVFSRKRGVFPNPELFIGRSLIKVVTEFKFLGLIFDQSLRFHRHLKDLKIRSTKALNILKVIANTRWGADRTSLLRLYRALIRSKLDYGSVVYSSACKISFEDIRSSASLSPETLSGSLSYITGRVPLWQSNWDQQTENKLHSVMSILAPTVPSSSNRREQVIWTRMRLRHSRLTHRHLRKPSPYCEKCNVPLSAKHILCDCPHSNHLRHRLFNSVDFTISNILNNSINSSLVFKFISINGFINHI
ncbi:uncharacterized protein TNCV_768291 [Trichonephila clavipes]|nr:uncharacterized protein TNCV_768291 [Trichonephila clavipes]